MVRRWQALRRNWARGPELRERIEAVWGNLVSDDAPFCLPAKGHWGPVTLLMQNLNEAGVELLPGMRIRAEGEVELDLLRAPFQVVRDYLWRVAKRWRLGRTQGRVNLCDLHEIDAAIHYM